MDPQKITELANLLRNNGDKILTSEFKLTLSGALLRALNDSFTLIADTVDIGGTQETFQVVKSINSKSPVFRDLQLIHDFVQKTTLLCIVHYPGEEYFEGNIDINKFRALKRLEVQKTNIRQLTGIQPLRSRLQQLVCVKSLNNVEDIIIRCGGDNSNGFVWNELKIADFSYNNLQTVDTSLEFAQYLQHLNLRHNKLHSVAAIKWLPSLKTLDLSFNCLQCIPQFHTEACKRLQSLNMSNNFIEDLIDVAKLDALLDLDLSDNCLMQHSSLLPLSALMTLSYLNLYGNPLHFHPKHRLETAQYLHKNTATVKFVLDFEPLSKSEKSLTGKNQLRSINRFLPRSSSSTISIGRSTPTQTPASSLDSRRSFKLNESSTDTDIDANSINNKKKRVNKVRTVNIEEAAKPTLTEDERQRLEAEAKVSKQELMTRSLLEEEKNKHLEAKKQIETLRQRFGAEWLQTGNAEMMESVMGIDNLNNSKNVEIEREKSRLLIKDFLGEISDAINASTSCQNDDTTLRTSTPKNDSYKLEITPTITPIKLPNNNEATVYMSLDNNQTNTTTTSATNNITTATQVSDYKSADSGLSESESNSSDNEHKHSTEPANNVVDYQKHTAAEQIINFYSNAAEEHENVASEPEDDEAVYIAYSEIYNNEAIFLTISSNYIREKDTLTQRTITKWSLQILESCERSKSDTLRIIFDTVKKDKQQRVYTMDDDLCQELEKKLRYILSQRDLDEMNITIYRCVNCKLQFSTENNAKKYKRNPQETCCPDCKSTFIAEVHHELPASSNLKLSPAVAVEESHIATPIISSNFNEKVEPVEIAEETETNSIGSANSLNESSSCSRISRSRSSFDSNQSVVGSSNTERDNEFQNVNFESDVDIISNPSQSSIEVLEHSSQLNSRKTSEERRISHIPNLETISDYDLSNTHNFIQREFINLMNQTTDTATADSPIKANTATDETLTTTAAATLIEPNLKAPAKAFAHLTESSSSGSITDSVCTTYEKQQEREREREPEQSDNADKLVTRNLLAVERSFGAGGGGDHITKKDSKSAASLKNSNSNGAIPKEDSGISSMFGTIFQSTNILMSSSKKLLDAESTIKTGSTVPQLQSQSYKFNYNDFNDVDHRLKLYFYQTKFEGAGEHFKWLARGRIYNETTNMLCDGIVVMSTCKCYLMEVYAVENDDVEKWLRQIVSVTVDRLESIQLLPWKVGLAFKLRGWGGFLLLLQDILRTDSLLLYFANDMLPSQCELNYQPSALIVKRLTSAIMDEQLQMFCILNNCEITFESAKRTFNVCGLLTTDTHIFLSSEKWHWLSLQLHADIDNEVELCVTQLMSNLVDVERPADNVFVINFLDETEGKYQYWKCTFETKDNAESCLITIGQSWEKLFGVPLLNA